MRIWSQRTKTTRVLTAAAATFGVIVASVFVGVTVANAADTGSAVGPDRTLQIRSEKTQRSFTSTSWTDVPGTSMTVGAMHSSIVIARFGAQSMCEGADGWCSVRIMIAGPSGGFVEGLPADGTNFVWSWAGTSWGQTMIERHVQMVFPPANPPAFQFWTVKVQVALKSPATRFRLQDWTLAVEVAGSS